jgi:tRNA dimethylallyltransferase
VIVGPTGVGKSALGVLVGQELDGEVISADSMQAYIGMDIGTATPDAAEQAGVPHHLLDRWHPSHALTVAEFQRAARSAIEDVLDRGRLPIVVGGSGLYVSAIMDDLRFPGTDPAVRARLEGELGSIGAPGLHERLAQLDPAAAAAILPSNGRRIVRALEVIELTGGTFTATLPNPVDVYRAVRIGIEIPRADMDARIAARVQLMWDRGFVDEVCALDSRPPGLSTTAARALGYQQVLDYLSGRITEEQAQQQTVDATRRFARRQQRWFGRDRRIHWIGYDADDLLGQVVGLVDSEPGTAQ